MRFLMSILLAVWAVAVSASPSPTIADLPEDPFDDTPGSSHEVIPSPGAEPIALNGTIAEVYAQILEINSNYEEDWNSWNTHEKRNTHSNTNTNITTSITARESHLERRKRPDVHCKVPGNGQTKALAKGIEYLRTAFTVDAGLYGNRCKMVSCSYDTAIRWCNDRPTLRTLKWNNIADGAQVIYDWCQKDSRYVGGWLGHNDAWRVFVEWEKC